MYRERSLELLLALMLILAVPTLAAAQDNGSNSVYSVGLQSSWPAYGLSAKMDMSDKMTVQGVLGALGSLTTLSGRAYWYLDRKEKYGWYGFGTAGVWRWSPAFGNDETSFAFGGGAGIELDWRAIIDPDFPRLASNIDLGLTMANFDSYSSWSLLGFGVGLHYHF